MKNKGFTLVEVIDVIIAILLILRSTTIMVTYLLRPLSQSDCETVTIISLLVVEDIP